MLKFNVVSNFPLKNFSYLIMSLVNVGEKKLIMNKHFIKPVPVNVLEKKKP